jgi:hypothetical protein
MLMISTLIWFGANPIPTLRQQDWHSLFWPSSFSR